MARIMINHVPHHQDSSDPYAINHINQIKLITYSGVRKPRSLIRLLPFLDFYSFCCCIIKALQNRFISLSPTTSGILSNPIGGRRVLAQVHNRHKANYALAPKGLWLLSRPLKIGPLHFSRHNNAQNPFFMHFHQLNRVCCLLSAICCLLPAKDSLANLKWMQGKHRSTSASAYYKLVFAF